jgi:hypothetical protein
LLLGAKGFALLRFAWSLKGSVLFCGAARRAAQAGKFRRQKSRASIDAGKQRKTIRNLAGVRKEIMFGKMARL